MEGTGLGMGRKTASARATRSAETLAILAHELKEMYQNASAR